jgi:hypothetical protein
MTRVDIKQIIERGCNAEIASISSAAKALNVDRHVLGQWLIGIDYLDCGRKKLYLSGDIAGAVIEHRKVR